VIEPNSSTYKVTDALGYDSFGNVNSDTVTGVGMAARQTTASWGTTGQLPMSVTDASGAQTQLNYNFSFGLPSSVTDPNGRVITWQYGDGFGRKTQETRPDGTYTVWQYLDMNNDGYSYHGLLENYVIYGIGATYISDHDTGNDSADRLVVQLDRNLSSGYNQFNLRYDSLGRTAGRSFPCAWVGWTATCSNWSTYNYDAINRLTQIQRPVSSNNSSLQATTYTYAGRTTTITDANGHAKTLVNDVNGWLRRTQDATGYYVTLGFDAAGAKTSATDSLGNTLWSGTYQYGIGAFLTSATDSDLGSWTYTPDALGEVTAWRDAKLQNFSAVYDALSRPTDRYEPDLYTHWTWGTSAAAHEIGQLHSVCTGAGANPTNCTSAPGYAESETYDSLARPYQRSIQIPADATYIYTRQYNATTGFLDTLTYPTVNSYALQLKYAYQNGLLQSITNLSDSPNVTVWTANATNFFGQVTQETLGNGVVVNSAFDAVTTWLNGRTAGVGGGAGLQNNSYLFDEVGNLTQRQDGNAGTTENVYTDVLNRLDHTVGGTNDQHVYDAMGRVISSPNSSTTFDYTTPQSGCTYYANAQVHAIRHAQVNSNSIPICYDANGNRTTVGGTWPASYSWMSFNQPSAVSAFGDTGTFSYDHNHQRWKMVETNPSVTTIYVGGLLEKMTNATGTAYRHYIPAGNNTIVYTRWSTGSNPTYYLTTDHLGSTAVVSDKNGANVVKESFAALGWSTNTGAEQATIGTVSPQGFTGQEQLNEFALVNMNGRMYTIGGQGVFLSPDPTIQDPSNTQNYNRYSYVWNNPVTYVDPTGFSTGPSNDFRDGGGSLWDFASFGQEHGCSGGGCGGNDRSGSENAGTGGGGASGGGSSQPTQIPCAPGADCRVSQGDQQAPTQIPCAPGVDCWGSQGDQQAVMAATGATSRDQGLQEVLVQAFLGPVAATELETEVAVIARLLGGAGLLLFPTQIGQDRSFVFHYTTNTARDAIIASGMIIPSTTSGVAWVSPTAYDTSAAAQSDLSLRNSPDGFFIIPMDNLKVSIPLQWGPVLPMYGQPGGGIEGTTPSPIPIQGATWVRWR
jgi:RHS repeat-associated protein